MMSFISSDALPDLYYCFSCCLFVNLSVLSLSPRKKCWIRLWSGDWFHAFALGCCWCTFWVLIYRHFKMLFEMSFAAPETKFIPLLLTTFTSLLNTSDPGILAVYRHTLLSHNTTSIMSDRWFRILWNISPSFSSPYSSIPVIMLR